VKDSLPEGTIAAALVVEATEENSSESDLSVIFWKRLLPQRIGENELENPELEELEIQCKVNLRLMGRSILMDAPPASAIC